jgi:hypothetical protein
MVGLDPQLTGRVFDAAGYGKPFILTVEFDLRA